MLKSRSEEDILSRTPIRVRLGDKDYDIPLLGINAQRKWRQKLGVDLEAIIKNFNQRDVSEKAMLNGLAGALVEFPEKLADLVFAYGTELPKDEILEKATEEQIAAAFSAIMVVAFPFLAQLGLVTQLVRATSNPQA
jgi:hypothetical protein